MDEDAGDAAGQRDLSDLLKGGLGGLLGGAGGRLLGGGRSGLLRQFQQNGYGAIANPGSAKARTVRSRRNSCARRSAQALSTFAEQAGLSDIAVLSQLSRDLPGAIDQLTPDGLIPDWRRPACPEGAPPTAAAGHRTDPGDALPTMARSRWSWG